MSKVESLKFPVAAAEEDMQTKGNLVVSVASVLGTLSLNSGRVYGIKSADDSVASLLYLAGEPPMEFINGFHQISENEILVADYKKNCVRMVVRHKGDFQTPVIAGKCEENGGYVDGKALDARFNYPHNIIASPTIGSFYIIEHTQIRILNTINGIVSTLLHHPANVIWDAKLSPSKEFLYYVTSCHLYKHAISAGQTELFAGKEGYCGRGDSLGLHQATFLGLSSLLFLNNYTILISDSTQGNLRIVNICSNTVSTFCIPSQIDEKKSMFIAGPKTVCSLPKPQTIMYSSYLNAALIMSLVHSPLMLSLNTGMTNLYLKSWQKRYLGLL